MVEVSAGEGVWVSNVLLVWSILTLVVVAVRSIAIVVFRPEGVYVPVLIKQVGVIVCKIVHTNT